MKHQPSFLKKAFTISEVIVATFISTLILGFIFVFLADMTESIAETDNEILALSTFYEFNNQLNNYRNVYISGGILINTATGSDVFLMQDVAGENGILFGPIKESDGKLNLDPTVYDQKTLGFRKVSQAELDDINSDVDVVYDYIFQRDQMYSDIKIQDLSLVSYNSGNIYDMTIMVDIGFQSNLIGQLRKDLPRDTLQRFNIDF